MSNKSKAAIYIELHPFEKEAYLKWIQGRYHSVSEAIRCHIRKVTGLDPESQEKNHPNSPPATPMGCHDQQKDPSAAGGLSNQSSVPAQSQQNSQPAPPGEQQGVSHTPEPADEKMEGDGGVIKN